MPSPKKTSPTSSRRVRGKSAGRTASVPTRTAASPSRRGRKPKSMSLREAREADLAANRRPEPSLQWVGDASDLHDIEVELEGYWDFLLGREPLPIENGVLSLMESAVAIHTRVQELTAMIQLGEYHGTIPKGSNMYRLRTGPLRQ